MIRYGKTNRCELEFRLVPQVAPISFLIFGGKRRSMCRDLVACDDNKQAKHASVRPLERRRLYVFVRDRYCYGYALAKGQSTRVGSFIVRVLPPTLIPPLFFPFHSWFGHPCSFFCNLSSDPSPPRPVLVRVPLSSGAFASPFFSCLLTFLTYF